MDPTRSHRLIQLALLTVQGGTLERVLIQGRDNCRLVITFVSSVNSKVEAETEAKHISIHCVQNAL